MQYLILILILLNLTTLPSRAQLSAPLPATMAQPPLVYYRVALVTPTSFISKDVADAVCKEMTATANEDQYIFKVVENKNKTFSVHMLLRILFFDKAEAEKAADFLRNNPNYDPAKFAIQVTVCSDN